MKRELSYREEMVQQLHIVRGEKNKAEDITLSLFLSSCTMSAYLLTDSKYSVHADNPASVCDRHFTCFMLNLSLSYEEALIVSSYG